jgi:hypothetical protein
MKPRNKSEKLKAFLEQMYGKELTDAEVKEYKDRLVKFFSLLVEIDQRTKRKK